MNSMLPDREPKITAWQQSVQASGCHINAIEPLNMIRKPDNQLLFGLLRVQATDEAGWSLPSIVFIRGGACVIVPLIINAQTGEHRYCMVQQRRIGNGHQSLEFPAGMLDRDILDPVGVAVRELEEETGLRVCAEEMMPLTRGPLYSSPGASDESIYYFGCRVTLDHETFQAIDGRRCGCVSEQEKIRVVLRTRHEAEQEATSCQVRLALYLFEEYATKNFRTGER